VPSAQQPLLQYAVIAARYQGKWLLVRHRERATFELPGGHIERGETPDEAAARELREESGADRFSLEHVCDYGVERDGAHTYGALFFAEIERMGALPPEFEMEERRLFDALPPGMTYPEIQPALYERALQWLERRG
jgi:8-oxo-dGTP diphosphatase